MQRNVTTLTDEDLFPLMAKHDGAALAREAFEELYSRNAAHLYGAFRRVAAAVHYGKDDLLQDTFVRAFERARNYKPEGLDAEAARRRVRAWLCRIADRLVKEKWPRDRQGFVRLVHLTQECWQAVASDGRAAGPVPGPVPRVREALQTLKPRDREIILIYMHWYDPELQKQRIPPEVVGQVCAHYQISRENFRQIVTRTLRRLGPALGGGA